MDKFHWRMVPSNQDKDNYHQIYSYYLDIDKKTFDLVNQNKNESIYYCYLNTHSYQFVTYEKIPKHIQ